MSSAPGPRGLALVRTIAARRRDPVPLLGDLSRTYGGVVHIGLGDMSQFVISDLDAVKHVLVDNHRNYVKGPAYTLLASLLGHGVLTTEGEDWKRKRRVVQPALQRERMRAFMAVMNAAAEEEATAMRGLAARGAIVDVFPRMMDLALRVVSRTLLGTDVGAHEASVHDAMTRVLDHIEALSVSRLRLLELLPGGKRLRRVRAIASLMPTGDNRAFEEAIATLDELIHGVIARRRADTAPDAEATDLVSQLLLARDESGAPALTDAEIRDEVMTMFIAGHETTATALSWCLHLLAVHPEHQDRIAAEAAIPESEITLDDLPGLVASRAAFEESMRLYPPVWRISRTALAADSIGGHDVRAGSIIVVSPYVIHRDPSLWDDPERFDPSRFTTERSRERPRLAYIPFGAGQRMCVGAAFATAEAQVILSALCRAVRFLTTSPQSPAFEPRVTLRPRGGMLLKLQPRSVPALSESR